MRLCLGAIIKTQYSFDDSVQLSRQLDGPRSAAVGAAWAGELMHLNCERAAELRDRAGKHYGATPGVLQNHIQTMCGCKLAYRCQIGRIGTVRLGELFPTQKSDRAISSRKFGHSSLHRRESASSDDHAHFKSFRWIRWGD
jgi:hypothetical protein